MCCLRKGRASRHYFTQQSTYVSARGCFDDLTHGLLVTVAKDVEATHTKKITSHCSPNGCLSTAAKFFGETQNSLWTQKIKIQPNNFPEIRLQLVVNVFFQHQLLLVVWQNFLSMPIYVVKGNNSNWIIHDKDATKGINLIMTNYKSFPLSPKSSSSRSMSMYFLQIFSCE